MQGRRSVGRRPVGVGPRVNAARGARHDRGVAERARAPKARACTYGRSQAEDDDDAMVPGADTLVSNRWGQGKLNSKTVPAQFTGR